MTPFHRSLAASPDGAKTLEQLPRGSSVFFTKVARTPGQRYRTFSYQAGLWLRVESWLNAVAKTGVKVGHGSSLSLVTQSQT